MGDVVAKSMFGGYGLFLDGLMFGLVARNDELFLKADDANRPEFEERGLKPYRKMPYFAAPPECLEVWSGMERWARGGGSKQPDVQTPARRPRRRCGDRSISGARGERRG